MRTRSGFWLLLAWVALVSTASSGQTASSLGARPELAARAAVEEVDQVDRVALGVGGEGPPSDNSTREQNENGGSLRPWASPELAKDLRVQLEAAVGLAVRQLREKTPCRQLFRELGLEGEEALARTLYYPAEFVQEQRFCRGGSAFTLVGSRLTRLCRSFRRLNRKQAAVIVLHEALHQAGLSERPLDPQGMDSSEINQLVERSCGL